MKKTITFVILLFTVLTVNYQDETKAAGNFENMPEILSSTPPMVAPEFTSKPADIIAEEGDVLLIVKARVTGTKPITIRYTKNGEEIYDGKRYVMRYNPEKEEITFMILDLVPEDSGEYKIIATNKAGEISTSFKLKVNTVN